MLDVDPQAGLPEFLRRRQPIYAQMPQGLLSQQAFQAAGPFPQYNPAPMNIAPPLPPAPSAAMPGTGSAGAAGAGLGGLLGLAAQNPSGVSSLVSGARNLLGGGGVEGLANLGSLASLSSTAGIGAAGQPGLLSLGSLGGLSSTGVGTGSIASQAGGMSAALQAGAAPAAAAPAAASGAAPAASGAAAGGVPWGTVAGGAALLGGGLLAADGISRGREGQAALGGGLAGAGGASLAGMAALGPAGLIGAGIGAIAASLVNTREFGDKAFANYWQGVESGRGIGESDPTELAQGFVNLYRTNKFEFPGQARYGRTGNEEFLYDMTQQINSAVQSGRVPPNATPDQIYASVVQPWMSTMGEGTQDPRARAVQDHMMTDLVANYMAGRPISNAQVKGDRKFRIVSDRPVFPGSQAMQPTTGMEAMVMGANPDLGLLGGMY